jgi:TrkA family protein/RyR domain-containing protein
VGVPSGSTSFAPPSSPWRRLKVLWYERYRSVWRDARPVVLALATLAVFVLGTIGFEEYKHEHDPERSLLDSMFRSLTLFEFAGYDVEPPLPWTLELARWAAPAITIYAIFRGLIAVFRGQLQLAAIRLFGHNHVVVAGLGTMGFRLAKAFREEGYRVVVIEADEGNRSIQGCRDRGISVLVGDASDPRVLAKAHADRARYLIGVCGDDGRNVEVEVAADRISDKRGRGTLHALVHLDDAGLWRMLKSEVIAHRHARDLRLEFFNVHEIGARLMLEERPPFGSEGEEGRLRPHVVLAGLEGIGDALVRNIARLWQNRAPGPGESLLLTVLAPDADAACARLIARYPELEQICELNAVSTTLGAELQRGPLALDPDRPVSAVYVSVAREGAAIEVALALRARAELRAAPITVAVSDLSAGLATLLSEATQAAHGVHGFGVLDRALDAQELLRGDTEIVARAKHEEYLRHEVNRGGSLGEGLLVPWAQLPEEFKDANRAFADGVGDKLAAAGCALLPAPLIDPRGRLFEFTDDEVERLAELEHERWMADKLRAGWRYGPVRDDARKVHDCLVEWAQLPEEEADKDRQPVRELPLMLAYAGFEIVRPAGTPTSDATPAAATV